jgi:GNAT superfamily N-acetyltransferase
MGKAPTRNWPNPTRAAIQLPVGDELKKVSELLTLFLGDGAVPEDVAHVVGALDDAMVHLSPSPDGQAIHAQIEHADFEQWERHLRKDKDGKIYVWNEKMRIRPEKQGAGIGASRLRAQVENAFYAGIAYLACHAARVNAQNPDPRRGFIGYLLWPKCGFDQTLDDLEKGTDNADDVRKGTPAAFPQVAEAIRELFGHDVKSIQDLFDEEGGPEWWQSNGVELYHATFGLTEGARSLRVFNEYLLNPKRGGINLCLKNPI